MKCQSKGNQNRRIYQKENQKNIYNIPGQSIEEVEESPFMDNILEKDLEVIYMTDPANKYMIKRMRDSLPTRYPMCIRVQRDYMFS